MFSHGFAVDVLVADKVPVSPVETPDRKHQEKRLHYSISWKWGPSKKGRLS